MLCLPAPWLSLVFHVITRNVALLTLCLKRYLVDLAKRINTDVR